MDNHLEIMLHETVRNAGLSEHLVQELLTECPWLNGEDEVDHDIGAELLEAQIARFLWTPDQVERLLSSYNDQVIGFKNPHSEIQSEAYAAVLSALTGFGKEDAYGQGDFWLVEDSFSTPTPTIMVFRRFRLPFRAIRKLQIVLSVYSSIFKELRIVTADGDSIAAVTTQSTRAQP